MNKLWTKINSSLYACILGSLFWSGASAQSIANNRFSDPLLQQLFSAGYHRQTDSLLLFFKHEQAVYRKEAALFFASWHDSTAISPLEELLVDADKDVRTAAAFAIGQIGVPKSTPILIQRVQDEPEVIVKRYLLEAIGQCSDSQSVDFLARFTTQDTLEEAGVAWGLYRATSRRIFSKAGSDRMARDLASSNSYDTRHAAAYYFSQLDTTVYDYVETLLRCVQQDPAPNVRMGILRGLRKINRPEVRNTLLQLADEAADYRLRVDAIQALRQFNSPDVQEIYQRRLLQDPHISVRITAAESIAMNPDAYPYQQLINLANNEKNIRIRLLLLQAALKTSPHSEDAIGNIEQLYSSHLSVSERKEILSLLSSETNAYPFLLQVLEKEKNQDLLLTTGSALRKIRNQDDFPAQWKQTFTEKVTPKLPIRVTKPRTGGYAPIDWKEITAIPTDCKIRVKTKRGSFTLRTFVEEAPFTVAHFISLLRQGALNGMEFYRVVPNFVNQTGGAKDLSMEEIANIKIRSEFKIRPHSDRAVNMASAGPDTESSHFSIMLRSTPWNDYHYTVFAEVIDGMEVVHRLELGDRIEKVTLIQ